MKKKKTNKSKIKSLLMSKGCNEEEIEKAKRKALEDINFELGISSDDIESDIEEEDEDERDSF